MGVTDPAPTKRQRFDVDLLCAKLEAVKLEQDTGRFSRRYDERGGNYDERAPAAEHYVHSTMMPKAEARSKVPWTDEKDRVLLYPRKAIGPKQLFAALNIGKSQSEVEREVSLSESSRPDYEPLDQSRRREGRLGLDDVDGKPRPFTASCGYPTRQQSLPLYFGDDSRTYFKQGEREKKRRTLTGLFKKFS